MFERFSNNLTVSKILRIFGHAKFPQKTYCLRCHFKFSLLTRTYLERSFLPLDGWYELLWWFAYEFTANKTAKEVKLPQQRVHNYFSLIRKAIYNYERPQLN